MRGARGRPSAASGWVLGPTFQARAIGARRSPRRLPMWQRKVAAALTGGALVLGLGEAAGAVDLELARQQFLKSCGTCHSAEAGEPDRQGPNLYGIVGRPAGTRPEFAYSEALKGGRWVWDEAALDRFMADPQEAHPGTFMPYSQPDPQKRALIVGFLRQQAADPSAAGKP
jgi:cytochrome c